MEEKRSEGKQDRIRKRQSDVLLAKSSASAALNEADQPLQQFTYPIEGLRGEMVSKKETEQDANTHPK